MGEQVRELFTWARRRKILATFFVVLTLAVGILIGSIVSGRTSAMKSFGFGGTTATPLAVPDPIPATNSFAAIVNRVVEQATKIQVQLNGETTRYAAKVVGIDEDTDLAVIKIDANKDLPTAKLGNSDGVQVGDWVLAIGSPFGLQATVTAGIISAKDRG